MIPSHYSRREMVQALGGGLGAVALAQALGGEAIAGQAQLPQPHFLPRAKRVIQLFMNGGPFQADTFDPKPALNKFAGQRPAEVQFRTENETGGLMAVPYAFKNCGQSGLPVSELLPKLGECIDDLCIIRSMHTDNPNHGPALFLMNNGTITPTRPSMGSWMLYGLGSENADLPGYVVLCPGRPVRFAELWSSGFLPGEHQGMYINHTNLDPTAMVPNVRNTRTPHEAQRRQLDLTQRLNQLHAVARGGDDRFEARMQSMETAFRMQFAASDAFDLAKEPAKIREEYGTSHYANGCLLARRLVERGVRFVQVYYGNGQPWDTHRSHDSTTRSLCKDIDQPTAALIGDLKRRGLLEDTLVIWGGEFGRTIYCQGKLTAQDYGRDHHPRCFTIWLAGGGFKPGVTYGETDDFSYNVAQSPMHVHDLHATMLHQLGIDHERLTFQY